MRHGHHTSLRWVPAGRGPRGAVVVAALALAAALAGCSGGGGGGVTGGPRIVVLGFDGMDHGLTSKLMAEGRLPALSRLAERGTFNPLATSVPPQSPVAWSNFITGTDAGTHGIFDFIHRDPDTMFPEFSTAQTASGEENCIGFGKWKFPMSGGEIELLRRGQAFWEVLEQQGVETTIIRMPANFPPSGTASHELSGMGTPDLLGTYGTYSVYTSDPVLADRRVNSGDVYPVDVLDHTVQAKLYGPPKPCTEPSEDATADFSVYLDPDSDVVKLAVGSEERILEEGEWSDWVPVELEVLPFVNVRAICRFYLKEVRPDFKLYVTPLNFDPFAPALPISTPDSYAAELASATGNFYTQGMPEDTQAYSSQVLTPAEFLAQSKIAGDEIVEQYRHVLGQFNGGLLFYYFGNVDQISHMMWRTLDPEHPAYDEETDGPYAGLIGELYEGLDAVVGYTLENVDDDTLVIVMSDHGFGSWRRGFNLNTWLLEQGYLAELDPYMEDDPGLFQNVDWSLTQAYGLGVNGLYINLQGRERWGTVQPEEREAVMEDIAEKLLATVDPKTGEPAITKVYRREEVFSGRGALEIGPDLIVGYAKGTRCSNASTLGEISDEVFSDNMDEWSGDHCWDHETVPGVLFTSRPLKKSAARLQDLGAAIVAEFGIDEFPASE